MTKNKKTNQKKKSTVPTGAADAEQMKLLTLIHCWWKCKMVQPL